MAESEIQKNIREKNAEYASTFTQGDLALPPAKKYLVCTYIIAYIHVPIFNSGYATSSQPIPVHPLSYLSLPPSLPTYQPITLPIYLPPLATQPSSIRSINN